MVTAVTGDIGSGKSTVTAMLSRLLCCRSVDADKIALEAWTRPDVKRQAVSRWGSSILDAEGNIIKSEIARIIFADREEHSFCNRLIHPVVMNQIHALAGKSDIIAEIPLLPPENIEGLLPEETLRVQIAVNPDGSRTVSW